MEAAAVAAYVDGRELEMFFILIFLSGMKLCCRSIQVTINGKDRHAQEEEKNTKLLSK